MAIKLEMDIPGSCSKCSMYESGGYNELLEPYDGSCFMKKRCMNGHKVTKGRPEWCPLKDEDFNVDMINEQLEDYGKYKGVLLCEYNTCENYIPVSIAKQIVRGRGIGEILGYLDEKSGG